MRDIDIELSDEMNEFGVDLIQWLFIMGTRRSHKTEREAYLLNEKGSINTRINCRISCSRFNTYYSINHSYNQYRIIDEWIVGQNWHESSQSIFKKVKIEEIRGGLWGMMLIENRIDIFILNILLFLLMDNVEYRE